MDYLAPEKALKNIFLEEKVVGFDSNGFKLKSGKHTYWYANCRVLAKKISVLDPTATTVNNYIRQNLPIHLSDFDAIIGVPEGAGPLGEEVQRQFIMSKLIADNVYYPRTNPKEHGDVSNKYWVNGNVPKKVILFEDVTTTAGSVLKFALMLESMGIEIISIISLFNRLELDENKKNVVQKMQELGYKYYSMLNANDILQDIVDALPIEERAEAIEKINAEFEMDYGDDSPVALK